MKPQNSLTILFVVLSLFAGIVLGSGYTPASAQEGMSQNYRLQERQTQALERIAKSLERIAQSHH
jgi:uncharacterized protein YneF (UPF0154 family)